MLSVLKNNSRAEILFNTPLRGTLGRREQQKKQFKGIDIIILIQNHELFFS